MPKEFRPGWEAFFIRLLWIFWPASLVVSLDYLAILERHNHAFDLLLSVGMAYWLVEAFSLHFRKLSCRESQLVITDIFGRQRAFDWNKIDRPEILIRERTFFPRREWLIFNYGEGGEVSYMLSELKDKDQEQALVALSCHLGRMKEIDL